MTKAGKIALLSVHCGFLKFRNFESENGSLWFFFIGSFWFRFQFHQNTTKKRLENQNHISYGFRFDKALIEIASLHGIWNSHSTSESGLWQSEYKLEHLITRNIIYKKHRENEGGLVSKFFLQCNYFCCLFVYKMFLNFGLSTSVSKW